jgi:hypothetical protein
MNVEHEVGSVWHQDTVQQEGQAQPDRKLFLLSSFKKAKNLVNYPFKALNKSDEALPGVPKKKYCSRTDHHLL